MSPAQPAPAASASRCGRLIARRGAAPQAVPDPAMTVLAR